MKKHLLLALTICTSLLNSGCSKNDDPTPLPATPDTSQLILGRWYPTNSVIVTTTSTGQSSTQTLNYLNRAVSEAFTATDVTTYSSQSAAGAPRPYIISGNTYTINDGGGASRKFEIVTLTSSSFVRRYTSTSGTSTSVATTTLVR
jgi:hypothetical protein